MSKPISLRLDKPTRELLEAQANEKGLSLSTYIRFLVKTHPDLRRALGIKETEE